jgi:hypothetical protein
MKPSSSYLRQPFPHCGGDPQQEQARAAIQTSQLINRLQNFALGENGVARKSGCSTSIAGPNSYTLSGNHWEGSSLIAQKINDFVTQHRPNALCDKCICEALDYYSSADAALIAEALGTTPDFDRRRGQCVLCQNERMVIRANPAGMLSRLAGAARTSPTGIGQQQDLRYYSDQPNGGMRNVSQRRILFPRLCGSGTPGSFRNHENYQRNASCR